MYHTREPAGARRIRPAQGRVRVGSARRGAGIRSILVGMGGRWMVVRVRGLEDKEGTLMELEDRRGLVQPREEVG